MLAASAAASFIGTRMPVSPCLTTSRHPRISVAITGSCLAHASCRHRPRRCGSGARAKKLNVNAISDIGNLGGGTQPRPDGDGDVFAALRQDAITKRKRELFRQPTEALSPARHGIVKQQP